MLARMPQCFLAALQHLRNGTKDPSAFSRSSRNNVYMVGNATTSCDEKSVTDCCLPDFSTLTHRRSSNCDSSLRTFAAIMWPEVRCQQLAKQGSNHFVKKSVANAKEEPLEQGADSTTSRMPP